ncbi:MAG: hypothetical protein D6758_08355 [Gammaproteobacteria bacterium]|nr:MAG: hypothetical protein D6758_08355 [Gammaproteobacteria bacterium]
MSSPDFSPGRRALLRASIASASAGLALGLGGCTAPSRRSEAPADSATARNAATYHTLDADTRALWRALLPAIGRGQPELTAQEAAFVQGIDGALRRFSLHNQAQLNDLFGLLTLAPSRLLLTGHWKDWPSFSPDDTHGVLERWRTSSLGLLNQAYAGLTRLGAATLYSLPALQARTGYPGPPKRALESLPQFHREATA